MRGTYEVKKHCADTGLRPVLRVDLAGLVGGFGVIATDGEPLWLGLLVGALGCFLAAGALVGFCDEDENT